MWPEAPSNRSTSGPPPGPAAATTSSTPSPVTSPVATRTPPWKRGSRAVRVVRSEPSVLNSLTSGADEVDPAVGRERVIAGPGGRARQFGEVGHRRVEGRAGAGGDQPARQAGAGAGAKRAAKCGSDHVADLAGPAQQAAGEDDLV